MSFEVALLWFFVRPKTLCIKAICLVELASKPAINSHSLLFTVQNGVLLPIILLMKGGFILATKEQRQNKNFVEKLLQIKGVDYDEWLDEQHLLFIQNSQSIILEALESKLNVSKASSGVSSPSVSSGVSNSNDISSINSPMAVNNNN